MKTKNWNETYSDLISKLEIDDLDKETLRIQWYKTLNLLDKNASHCRKMNTVLKLAVFLSGVLIPVLSNIKFNFSFLFFNLDSNTLVTILGILIAFSAGLNQQFKYEERWNHFRRNAELLRNEGENYFGLGGAYKLANNHKSAFRDFNTNVSFIKKQDVENYFEKVVTKNNKNDKV